MVKGKVIFEHAKTVIRKTEIPPDSLVGAYVSADYTDAFCCEMVAEKPFSADDIMVKLWTRHTGWVVALFRLRNFLVRFVGLQGDGEGDADAFEKAIREGDAYRFASVAAKNDRETVLLLTDKHLDAWLSVYVADKNCNGGQGDCKTVFAITVVKFNNRLGHIYFSIIRPFHNLVVKSMLKKAIEEVE